MGKLVRSVIQIGLYRSGYYQVSSRGEAWHIKVPRLSKIFDKVRFTSILSNSQSDHVSLVDAPIGNLIMHSFERSIEGGYFTN
jgi:hypothetical protein